MAMPSGPGSVAIAGPAVFVAVSIGVTEVELKFATYAVLPSGVIATPTGADATTIGAPAVLVLVSISVTRSLNVLVTYAVCAWRLAGIAAVSVSATSSAG